MAVRALGQGLYLPAEVAGVEPGRHTGESKGSADRGTAGPSGQGPGRPTVPARGGAHPSVIGDTPRPQEGKIRSTPPPPSPPTAPRLATMASVMPPLSRASSASVSLAPPMAVS